MERITGSKSCCKSLDLGANGVGMSFGNSRRCTGLRFNLVDRNVERVSGINLTFWKPGENPDAVVSGIAAGLYAPTGNEIKGISIGGTSVIGHSEILGLSLGGLAAVVNGGVSGISVSGLASVTEGGLSGISVGGLAAVADGDASGIMASGLSIGIVNYAQKLNGIELGLINIAKNSASPFKALPIVNAHFE